MTGYIPFNDRCTIMRRRKIFDSIGQLRENRRSRVGMLRRRQSPCVLWTVLLLFSLLLLLSFLPCFFLLIVTLLLLVLFLMRVLPTYIRRCYLLTQWHFARFVLMLLVFVLVFLLWRLIHVTILFRQLQKEIIQNSYLLKFSTQQTWAKFVTFFMHSRRIQRVDSITNNFDLNFVFLWFSKKSSFLLTKKQKLNLQYESRENFSILVEGYTQYFNVWKMFHLEQCPKTTKFPLQNIIPTFLKFLI